MFSYKIRDQNGRISASLNDYGHVVTNSIKWSYYMLIWDIKHDHRTTCLKSSCKSAIDDGHINTRFLQSYLQSWEIFPVLF